MHDDVISVVAFIGEDERLSLFLRKYLLFFQRELEGVREEVADQVVFLQDKIDELNFKIGTMRSHMTRLGTGGAGWLCWLVGWLVGWLVDCVPAYGGISTPCAVDDQPLYSDSLLIRQI